MHEMRDAGQEGCRRGEMEELRGTGKEGSRKERSSKEGKLERKELETKGAGK